MIGTIKTLFDLVAKLLEIRNKRRREIFTEVIQPLFDTYMKVHTEYNQLLISIKSAFPVPEGKGMWLMPDGRKVDSGSEDFYKQAGDAKEQLLEARGTSLLIRNKLRQDAKQILLAVEHVEEKRFLLTLINYFSDDEPGSLNASNLDEVIERIQKGRFSFPDPMDSPIFRLVTDIYDTNDMEELVYLVGATLNRLNQRFTDVCSSFLELQLVIYKNT